MFVFIIVSWTLGALCVFVLFHSFRSGVVCRPRSGPVGPPVGLPRAPGWEALGPFPQPLRPWLRERGGAREVGGLCLSSSGSWSPLHTHRHSPPRPPGLALILLLRALSGLSRECRLLQVWIPSSSKLTSWPICGLYSFAKLVADAFVSSGQFVLCSAEGEAGCVLHFSSEGLLRCSSAVWLPCISE